MTKSPSLQLQFTDVYENGAAILNGFYLKVNSSPVLIHFLFDKRSQFGENCNCKAIELENAPTFALSSWAKIKLLEKYLVNKEIPFRLLNERVILRTKNQRAIISLATVNVVLLCYNMLLFLIA